MDAGIARNIAHHSHLDDRDRSGRLLIEHVERVAAAVPDYARTVAFLHEVLEHSGTTVEALRAQGLSDDELAAIELLTRSSAESYELHVLRIAWAPGLSGEIARHIQVARERQSGMGVAA